MITLATSSISGSSDNGYVAAAYIVFFAILLIYVAIMALRLTRVERSLRELNERASVPPSEGMSAQGEVAQNGGRQAEAQGGQAREREAV
jgi:hypothetical protein